MPQACTIGHSRGTRPDGAEQMALDRLAAEPSAALLALRPRQTAGIMAATREPQLPRGWEAARG